MSDDPLFEIKDAAVNDEALRREIDRRAAARGLMLPAFPTYGRLAATDQTLDDSQLNYYLQEVTARYAVVDLDLDLAASPATQLPLIGPIWNGVRRHLHEVILFYVHKLAGHTTTVNHHLVGALNELARRSALQEEELNELRARVEELEEKLSQIGGPAEEEPS